MRRISLVILSCLAISTNPHRASAQTSADHPLAPVKAAEVDKAVRKVMAEQELVGVSIGVIQDGKVCYLQGYGWADREKRIPMKVETVVNWASNSKPMAAILAMQLVEKGLLDLDADVRKYVPEFPDKGTVITCRQLLCHQSGIPHYSNGKIVPGRSGTASTLGPIRSLDRFSGSALIFKPGEKSEYSSYAYILLSAVVERAGKQPYDMQVRERVSVPLGLKSLQLDHRAPGAHWAVGYEKNGTRIVPTPDEANDWKFGAGGYKSDVRDFAGWAASLIDHRLVSAETERLMWTPQKTTDGKVTGYGLGFAIEGKNQGLKVSHSGKQDETTTRMALYPRTRQGVVVMSNCGYGEMGAVSTAIFAALGRGQ